MPPKGKGKEAAAKKNCLRCPEGTFDEVKCNQTIKCKSKVGEYAASANTWPGFPSDPDTGFVSKSLEECEDLIHTAESSKEYNGTTITKEMLQVALEKMQEKPKGTRAPKSAAVAGPAPTTIAAGPSSSKTAPVTEHEMKTQPQSQPIAPQEAQPETETESDPPSFLPEGSKPPLPKELPTREPEKSGSEPERGKAAETSLKRPQPNGEVSMPNSRSPPPGPGDSNNHEVDCRTAWTKNFSEIQKQRNANKSHDEIYTLIPGFADTSVQEFVRTNYFIVNLDPKTELYEYEINGIPESASKGKKKDLIETMILNCPVLRDQKDDYATDFNKKVIAWKDLFLSNAGEDDDASRRLTIPGRAVSTGHVSNTVLELKFVRNLTAHGLIEYVKGRQMVLADTGIIEALNILISKGLSAQSIEVGTNRYYYKPGHVPLTAGLVAIRGYFASIRPGMDDVLLNVNAVTGAFYDATRVSELRKLREDYRTAERFLKGVRVRIMYSRARSTDSKLEVEVGETGRESIDSERNRTRSIWSIGLPPKQQTFDKDGRKTTVWDYLHRTYPGLRIEHPDLRCINLGDDSHPCWYPPEKLQILPYQLYKTKLKPEEVTAMIGHACRRPDENRRLIMQEGLPSIGITAIRPPVLEQAKVQITSEMLEVPAFAMAIPSIEVGNKVTINFSSSSRYSYRWEIAKQKLVMTSRKYKGQAYTHLIYEDRHNKETLNFMVKEFNEHIKSYGFGVMNLSINNFHPIPNGNFTPAQVQQALDDAASKGADLVVLLLPSATSNDAACYRHFKAIADQVYGLKSICMAEDKLRAGGLENLEPGCLRSYMSGVALKLNLKLRNWNWVVSGTEIRSFVSTPSGKLDTMIVGTDVTHPSAASIEGTPSIAAVVGSVDAHCGRMPGSMRRQEGRQEMIGELGKMIEERLEDWYNEARTKPLTETWRMPSRIIYYRDGVAESQYADVKKKEIDQIRAAWANYRRKRAKTEMPNALPRDLRVTTVVVSKRHNTRFYPRTNSELRDDAGYRPQGKGNLKPGVVVESVVTSPYWHDFYPNSHFGLQGTVRPCHYIVLEDDNNMTARGLQRLTFLLCHMYQRAACSVSYVTPTYYADRLCERGRHYLYRFFDGKDELKDKEPPELERLMEADWKRPRVGTIDSDAGRQNPWHPKLDGSMFWL